MVVTETSVSPLGATCGASWQAPAAATATSTGNSEREIMVAVLILDSPSVQPAATRVMM